MRASDFTLGAGVLAAGLALASCGGHSSASAGAGGGEHQTPPMDGGGPPSDGGQVSPPGDAGSPPPDAGGPARYPVDAVHSPITSNVLASMTAIHALGQRNMKRYLSVGDANCSGETSPSDAANPFGLSPIPGVPAGSEAVVQYFLADKITAPDNRSAANVTESSLLRFSFACPESGTAQGVLDPPSLLDQEITATDAAFAIISAGGVEMYNANIDSLRHELDIIHSLDSALLEVVDHLIAQGIVPALRAFPSKYNCAACIDESAPPGCNCPDSGPFQLINLSSFYRSLVRGIAEGRQIPFADDNAELAQSGAKPGDWLDGTSGHLSQNPNSHNPSDFSDMTRGYAADSLVILQQLDRMRNFANGTLAPEANPGPARVGSGTAADPFDMGTLPFTDLRRLSDAQPSPITDFSSCGGAAMVDGPAYVYRVEVSVATAMRIVIFDRQNSPAKSFLRHFVGTLDAAHCVVSQDQVQTYDDAYATTLAPGTHYFVVASPSFTPTSTPADVGLTAEPCPTGDPRCAP
jgi:hypothetical protein